MSVRENITLASLERFARAGWIQKSSERSRVSEVCRDVGIRAASIDASVETLSGGNQQKTVLARWLSAGPRVLILDEPTRGVDVGAKAEIYHLVSSLAREGLAILMISSDMEEILAQSDRVAVMHEGRLTGCLHRGECTAESIMRLAVA